MAFISRLFSRTASIQKLSLRTFAEAAPAPAATKAPTEMVFTFASPAEAFYSESTDVKQVDLPTGSGAIGVLANHVPTLGVLAPGVVTVLENSGDVKTFFVSSGSYSVNVDSSVVVNAEEAVPVDSLDKDVARQNLAKAQSELASASTDVAKAEAEIAIECNQAIVNA